MITQQFGSIQTSSTLYFAMLCRDSDQHDLAVISWWKSMSEDSSRPAAALVRFVEQQPNIFTLALVNYFRTDDRGALFLPELTEDERSDFSEYRITLRKQDNGLSGEIVHPNKPNESGTLQFAAWGEASGLLKVENCTDWEHFKRWAADLRRRDKQAAFRGHGSNKFRLQTTIHRHGRARYERYVFETLAEFRNHAEAVLGINFDLMNPSDYGTLLGLAQHHGLPTPLLDFTDSPYIAAYFAFSDAVENKRLNVTHVRIYAISGDYLASVARPHIALATAKPYITSMMLSARHNPRLYAQQGRFLITNVSDIEDWLLLQNRERPVLSAADIPVECAATALEDLKYMGLTAGTLFPGLDGVCRAMKQTIILNATNRHHVELSPLGTTAR